MSLSLFKPILAGAQFRERLVGCAGAAVCVLLMMTICLWVPGSVAGVPAIAAPLGASAVLIFAVPASPLAQPWPVIGGSMVSALVGITMFRLCPDATMAAALAIGGAILLMSLLRCLHPPGGAVALTAVIGGPAIHDAGYAFALAPIGTNSVVLAGLGLLFHRLSGRSYPHRPAAISPAEARVAAGLRPGDIDAALADMHESFDIGREDLDLLLVKAEAYALQRRR